MSTVILIRAGSTDYDEQHRVLGTLDMPVNNRGVEQIREINGQLASKGIRLQAILTSPEDPACGTAHAVAEVQGGETKSKKWTNCGTSTRDCGRVCRSLISAIDFLDFLSPERRDGDLSAGR